MASTAHITHSEEGRPKWGRVLICGGTDWAKLGRKERGGKAESTVEHPDLLEPHILRSLANVRVTSIHASCCGCSCIALDEDGAAWLFGRNAPAALGVPGGDVISENDPKKLTAAELGAKGAKFVHAACGRSHSLLVGSDGQVWSAGVNNFGQCGHPICPEVSTFRLIAGPSHNGSKERVIKAAAGVTFSLLLTESGKVFSFGSGEKGQLGNGRTGEHIITGNKTGYDIQPSPILVKGLDDKKITQIACGAQHGVAVDFEGLLYVWGYNGYCRLGLGNQQDVLIPKLVPQFSGSNEFTKVQFVVAGPTNTVVVNRQGMYWMAGKWKNSGEGSAGSPYTSFRYMQDIMGCKILSASCGGVTHWATTLDDDGSVMTIAWGQNAANGELGLGPEEPKSATKPIRNNALNGINVIAVAAGQNTTLILASPDSQKFSDLPRHPLDVDAPSLCIVCGKENGEDDSPLECDKCDYPFHLGCLDPPLNAVPEGEWFCPNCREVPGEPAAKAGEKKARAKTKASHQEHGQAAKRKAVVPQGTSGSKKKKA